MKKNLYNYLKEASTFFPNEKRFPIKYTCKIKDRFYDVTNEITLLRYAFC